MLDPIAPILLIAMGIGLIALEALLLYFVILWFGLALLIVGLASYLIPFGDGLWQLGAAAVLALVLLFSLRSRVFKRFMHAKGKEPHDDFLNESGEGIIKEGKVYYKATYWKIKSDATFEENERVKVLSTDGASATVEKLPSATPR